MMRMHDLKLSFSVLWRIWIDFKLYSYTTKAFGRGRGLQPLPHSQSDDNFQANSPANIDLPLSHLLCNPVRLEQVNVRGAVGGPGSRINTSYEQAPRQGALCRRSAPCTRVFFVHRKHTLKGSSASTDLWWNRSVMVRVRHLLKPARLQLTRTLSSWHTNRLQTMHVCGDSQAGCQREPGARCACSGLPEAAQLQHPTHRTTSRNPRPSRPSPAA